MNKAKTIELDVDFIGGERSLTKEDEQAISDFLKQSKLQQLKSVSKTKKLRPVKRTKLLVWQCITGNGTKHNST